MKIFFLNFKLFEKKGKRSSSIIPKKFYLLALRLLGERVNDVAQTGERLVDGCTLLESVSGGAGALDTLGSGQIVARLVHLVVDGLLLVLVFVNLTLRT